MLFNQNDQIAKLIYIKNDNLYTINKVDETNLTLTAKNDRKNLLIFKNKSTYIKYNKYNKLEMKFDKLDEQIFK